MNSRKFQKFDKVYFLFGKKNEAENETFNVRQGTLLDCYAKNCFGEIFHYIRFCPGENKNVISEYIKDENCFLDEENAKEKLREIVNRRLKLCYQERDKADPVHEHQYRVNIQIKINSLLRSLDTLDNPA